MSLIGNRDNSHRQMDNQREIIEEFLIESTESLAQLDLDFVALEERPDDQDLLSSIFRAIHTIKGVSGFLGFTILGAVTHHAENILSQLRDGDRKLTHELTDLLLETFDAVKRILAEIESTSEEGDDDCKELVARLETACSVSTVEQASDELTDEPDGVEEAAAEVPVPAVEAPTAPAPQQPTPASATPPVQAKQDAEVQPARSAVADSTIRVSVEALDDLMNLVGELVLARNQILQFTTTQEDVAFVATSQRLNLITTELQAKVMKTRMQPIRVVWNKFPRVVRDLGQAFGKQIELVMEGAGTELDKTVVEAIKDPLTHIVRNSCDHGIESTEERLAAGKPAKGRLLLRAYHEGGQVNIEISDDGGGIDVERVKEKALGKGLLTPERAERMSEAELVKLVFMPGFSTSESVTSVSGRGVGMDVVRTNIEKIGGSIDLQSVRGQGTTLRIKIPLTLAIIPALVVTCGHERFAIPQVNLLELVRVEPGQGKQQIESIHGAPVYRLRGTLLPLIYLHDALRLPPTDREEDEPINIVVLQADERTFGLVVDDVRDTAEIVVKPLSKLLKGLSCYAGATVMGDGRVALILDVMGLAHVGKVLGEGRDTAHSSLDARLEGEGDRQKMLMFRCGDSRRLAVPLALVDRLEEFSCDRIELAGSRSVVQYRGRVLPLIQLGDYVDSVGDHTSTSADKVQVIVFSASATRFGVIVEEIVDIVEEAISIRTRSDSAGLLGSVVIGGQVTDVIDVRHLITYMQKDTAACGSDGGDGTRVLVVDSSPFARGLLRGDLEMVGHRVVEASDVKVAIERLGHDAIDVVVSSLDLPQSGSYELLKKLRQTPEFSHIPALGLSDDSVAADELPQEDLAFNELRDKKDRDAVLDSVARLARSVARAETVAVSR